MSDDLPLFPVTGWEVKTIPAYGAIFIRLPFLSHATQSIAESDPGRRYVLHLDQARELRDELSKSIHLLETAEFQAGSGEKH